MKKIYFLTILLLFSDFAAPQTKVNEKQYDQMQLVGIYSSGQPGANIYKFYDLTEDVLCYFLTPTVVGKRNTDNGQFIFEGNSVGSLSCMKVMALPARQTKSAK